MKKLLCLVLALALCLPLAGCHGSRERTAFAVPASFDESQTYEITFWAKNDTNMRQTDIYKQAIAEFQDLYPNCLLYTSKPSSSSPPGPGVTFLVKVYCPFSPSVMV